MKGSALAGAELGDGGERAHRRQTRGRREASRRRGGLVVEELTNHHHGAGGGRWSAPITTSGAGGGCSISAHTPREEVKEEGWKGGATGITDQARFGRRWPSQVDPAAAATALLPPRGARRGGLRFGFFNFAIGA
jgi:hypothetical protein